MCGRVVPTTEVHISMMIFNAIWYTTGSQCSISHMRLWI